jgi:hypothetical protein
MPKFSVNNNFKVIQNKETLVFQIGNILVKIIPLVSISYDEYDINNDIQQLSFFNEIKMQNYCYTIIPHICPKIYKYKIIYKDELKKIGITSLELTAVSFGFISMEYIVSIPHNPDNLSLIYIKMRILLELAFIGITHGDFHKNNFIFTGKPPYFKIIDFGQSHVIDANTQNRIKHCINNNNYVEALKLLCYAKRFNPYKPVRGSSNFSRESIADALINPREKTVSEEMYNWVCNTTGDDINKYLSANPPIKHHVKNVQYYSPIFKIKKEECYYPDDNLNIRFSNLIKRILLIVLIQGIDIEFIVDKLRNDRDTLHISQVLSAMSNKSDKPLTFIYDKNYPFENEIPEIPNIEEDILANHEKIEELFTRLKLQALRKKIPILVKQFFELKENTITLYNAKARLPDGRVNENFRSNIESMLSIIYKNINEIFNGNFELLLPFFRLVVIKPCIKQSFNLSACEVLNHIIKKQRDNEWIDDIDGKNVFGSYDSIDPDDTEQNNRHEIIVQFTDIPISYPPISYPPINYPLNVNEDITSFTKKLLIDNERKYVPHISRLLRRPRGTRLRLNNGSWGLVKKYGGTRKRKKNIII